MYVYFTQFDVAWIVVCVNRKQELSNLLHEKKYLKALGLAISLDQPHTVLKVIKGVCTGCSSPCHSCNCPPSISDCHVIFVKASSCVSSLCLQCYLNNDKRGFVDR